MRNDVAIVGIGHTAHGELPNFTANQIALDALSAALADAGIDKRRCDGLITCQPVSTTDGTDLQLGALAGMNPRYSATLNYGACNFSLHLGVMAIVSGLAEVVALVYGANHRTRRTDYTVTAAASDLGPLSGYHHIAGPAAMALRRHRHLYGTTEEQFGQIAVGQREWALDNPHAIFREPMSMEQYLALPYMIEPLRRPDITMISDGGVAIILTRRSLVSEHPRPPVYVRAIADATALGGEDDVLMRPMMRRTATDLYRAAGLGPDDVDVLYVQDPTAVWTLQALEHYGFCAPGEGGAFLEDGRTRRGGTLPLNTHGGQLSESYMWGWMHLVEAVRQLRGEAGPRQVSASTALYASTLGFQKSAATMLCGVAS